jgi:uncharacterized protein (DUF1800 family)
MTTYSPFIAANRFGLGIQPGEHTKIEKDPKGWLSAQVLLANRLPPRYAQLVNSAQLIEMADADYRQRISFQQDGEVTPAEQLQINAAQRLATNLMRNHANQRLAVAIESDTPFTERLVRFWSNHFSVTLTNNKPTTLYAGLAYENETIRANMNRRFEDMLLSVARHPVMLTYLDNTNSLGPTSVLGRQRNRGLNENLAREMLELHSVGVDGGYTQADVIALARMLTGWSVNLPTNTAARPDLQTPAGSFYYNARAHEPGTQQFLGKSYVDNGQQQAVSAIRDLANHPSTAVFIARKLVRHFIADQPPESAVIRLAKVFRDSRGDLASLHKALIDLDEAWDPRLQKLKTAEDFVVSTVRALTGIALTDEILGMLNDTLGSFNQTPFMAPSPAGWPEQAEHWGGPDALIKRVEFINMVTSAVGPDFDARDIVNLILPANPTLQTAVRRAESKTQALTLLLASPQLQWRA